MIIVTGAAGFIGSCLITGLIEKGYSRIIAVDDFSRAEKKGNLENKAIEEKIDRNEFHEWLDRNGHKVEFIFHIGARTDTTEFDTNIFEKLNTGYSKKVWDLATLFNIPLLYASSAATYGSGEHGYTDDHDLVSKLKPLNPYGDSKNDFDKWVLKQNATPPFWAGMKFFNVYGPNEYHKSRMASVIFHSYNQIINSGKVRLFRSHRPDFGDGQQLRDFVYVKDVVAVLIFMMENQPEPGLYNLGTGKARTFYDLATATFRAAGVEPDIEFIDTPADIRDKYQYFTEAEMTKLRKAGYTAEFTTLENGVKDYVQNYLMDKKYF